MINIRLPHRYGQLLPYLEMCLSAAQQQGFSTENIKIKQGSVDQLSVCDLKQHSNITFDLQNVTDANRSIVNANFTTIVYLSGEAAAPVVMANQVVINAQDDLGYFDRYSDDNGQSYYCRCGHELDTRSLHQDLHLSWLLAGVALGFTIEDSLMLARAASKVNTDVSRETIWPLIAVSFPKAQLASEQLLEADAVIPSMALQQPLGVYPVVDDVVWIERLLKLGIKTIQLRIKDSNQADLEQQIKTSIKLGRNYQAQVFINDYWQLAIKYQAYGVHLGQEDLAQADLNEIKRAGLRIGLSTHGYFELLRAMQLKPSYIALGHIFATTTKQMPSQPQGTVKLALYQTLLADSYPSVAIGGINTNNANNVWQCGVSSLAVVRAITEADDIQLVINSLQRMMAVNR